MPRQTLTRLLFDMGLAACVAAARSTRVTIRVQPRSLPPVEERLLQQEGQRSKKASE
jgi:hypothetical protein